MGKTSSASHDKYNKKAYDFIGFRVPKGAGDEIRQAAAMAGHSVNAYIVQAVRDRMERDGRPMAAGSPAAAPCGDGADDLPTA